MAVQRIGNRDPAIVYSSGWGQTNEFNTTVTFATVAGQTARFTFKGVPDKCLWNS